MPYSAPAEAEAGPSIGGMAISLMAVCGVIIVTLDVFTIGPQLARLKHNISIFVHRFQ